MSRDIKLQFNTNDFGGNTKTPIDIDVTIYENTHRTSNNYFKISANPQLTLSINSFKSGNIDLDLLLPNSKLKSNIVSVFTALGNNAMSLTDAELVSEIVAIPKISKQLKSFANHSKEAHEFFTPNPHDINNSIESSDAKNHTNRQMDGFINSQYASFNIGNAIYDYKQSLQEYSTTTEQEQEDFRLIATTRLIDFFKSISQVVNPEQLLEQYEHLLDEFKGDVSSTLLNSNKLHSNFDDISLFSKLKLLTSSSKPEFIDSLKKSVQSNLVINNTNESSLAFLFDKKSQEIINTITPHISR
jgi:hypothetical protein